MSEISRLQGAYPKRSLNEVCPCVYLKTYISLAEGVLARSKTVDDSIRSCNSPSQGRSWVARHDWKFVRRCVCGQLLDCRLVSGFKTLLEWSCVCVGGCGVRFYFRVALPAVAESGGAAKVQPVELAADVPPEVADGIR